MTRFGQSFTRCPKAWLRDAGGGAQELLGDWHRMHSLSLLPYGGGVLEQPAVWLEAMDVITAELATCREIATRLEPGKGTDGAQGTDGRRGYGR